MLTFTTNFSNWKKWIFKSESLKIFNFFC
jgi:hypothetical protein